MHYNQKEHGEEAATVKKLAKVKLVMKKRHFSNITAVQEIVNISLNNKIEKVSKAVKHIFSLICLETFKEASLSLK